jgi:hypothetical protein
MPQRTGDVFLMESFNNQGYCGHKLSILNGCRQNLQVTTLSDIASMSGTHLCSWAWSGSTGPNRYRWPRKPKMTRSNWRAWQEALRHFLRSPWNLQLNDPLNKWLTPPPLDWTWFFSPSEERLLHKQGHLWRTFRKKP